MKDTIHFMLDIETFGTTPGSIIDQIGYALFTEKEIIRTGLLELPVAPAARAGFTHSTQTDNWRHENGLNTIKEATALSTKDTWADLCQAMSAFFFTYQCCSVDWVWQKGEMDVRLLNVYLLRTIGLQSGLSEYWRINDVRTFLRTHNYEEIKRNTHNAEADAINQAESLIYCWQQTGSSYSKPRK